MSKTITIIGIVICGSIFFGCDKKKTESEVQKLTHQIDKR